MQSRSKPSPKGHFHVAAKCGVSHLTARTILASGENRSDTHEKTFSFHTRQPLFNCGSTDLRPGCPIGKHTCRKYERTCLSQKRSTPEQQSKDEASCYEWAVGNSGSDPFELEKQQADQAMQTEQAQSGTNQAVRGSGLRGALGGAAAGALIGEITNDNAGKGAAIGAVSGGLLNRRRVQRNANQTANQIEQQGQGQQQATREKLISFK